MTQENFSYTDAVNNIEQILQRIDNEDMDIDELTKSVKEVSDLIAVCKSKLRNTEMEVKTIIDDMEE